MLRLQDLCSKCGFEGTLEVNKNTKTNCNNSHKCALNVFTSSKHAILEENVNKTFNTYKKSFIHYIISFRDCEIDSKKLINNILNTMYKDFDSFSPLFYKRVDVYVSKWDSWFSRFSLFLKTLMVNGYICNDIESVIIATIKDYSDNQSFENDEFNSILNKYVFKYIKDMELETPKENGEYAKIMKHMHNILMLVYETSILQFIQEDRINNKINILFWSNTYRLIGKGFENELLELRINEIIKNSENVRLRLSVTKDTDKEVIESTVLSKYADSITNWNDL